VFRDICCARVKQYLDVLNQALPPPFFSSPCRLKFSFPVGFFALPVFLPSIFIPLSRQGLDFYWQVAFFK